MSPRVVPKPQEGAEQRRQELVEANARLDEAEKLRQVIENMRQDVARQETKRDRLAALGDGHIEVSQESYLQEYGISVEWQPILSKQTGLELAAGVEESIVPLREEIKTTEARVRELLS